MGFARLVALFECWATGDGVVTIGLLIRACAELHNPYAMPERECP